MYAIQLLCKPKVAHADVPVSPQQHIFRFEVPVNDATASATVENQVAKFGCWVRSKIPRQALPR